MGRRLSATLAAGVLLALPVGSLASAPTTPTPTTPTSSPAPSAPSFKALFSLTSSSGTTAALREIDDAHVELLVGKGTDLRPAPGVAALEGSRMNVPRTHIGTDAAGQPVVVYPRCQVATTGKIQRRLCDLRVYDVTTGTDRLAPGIRRSRRSEYEGVMDGGALLYAADAGDPAHAAETGLWYRPAGGTERRLARNPGRELALNGEHVAQVITDGAKDAGEEPCTNSTLVLRSTRKPSAGRVLGRECLYPSWTEMPSDAWTSPSFIGTQLVFVRQHVARGPSLFRVDLRTNRLREARVGALFGFAPTTVNSGVALRLSPDAAGSTDEPAADKADVVDGIRWAVRTKTLLKENTWVSTDPLA